MMTELEFLDRFQRQSDGAWVCTKPINVDAPNGQFTIQRGVSFSRQALFFGIHLAEELDQLAAKYAPSQRTEAEQAQRGANAPLEPHKFWRRVTANDAPAEATQVAKSARA